MGEKKKGFLHRFREMTQLVACVPTDDFGWILELTLKKCWPWKHRPVIPVLGKQRHANLCDFMTSKPSLVGELHFNERPCLKNEKRWVAAEAVLWLRYAHTPATTHAQKHLCKQSPENASVSF